MGDERVPELQTNSLLYKDSILFIAHTKHPLIYSQSFSQAKLLLSIRTFSFGGTGLALA